MCVSGVCEFFSVADTQNFHNSRMTVTIGFIDGDVVIVASDSAAVVGDDIMTRRAEPKVWAENIGPFSILIGIAGDFGVCNWIRHGFRWPAWSPDVEFVTWLTAKVAPALSASITMRFTPETPSAERSEYELVLGYPSVGGEKPRVFILHNNGDVCEPLGNFVVIGSGANAARGALYATREVYALSSWKKIEMALEASAEYDKNVRKPWTVLYAMSEP